ncbi:site-specific DNA-methyltransferase [Pseudoflavonifractor phocaeensis]|uniref:site-specific DNA-methyltransferase n=1 Tax=Pseudoflavonifractor phocaeensis TaxID=1870988 RepID=UPI00195AEB00|nr:site-specific DNA-methyltransferase [Pseudoflavonifractor phocaeensis]MBM6871441.1 site-specific DNA-methyltransferase [Pseudoflavonifractor phocaeensis]
MPDFLDGLSMNIEQTNLDKLRSLFPECVSEGKLDIDKLLSLCGEYIDNDFEKYRFEWKGKADCLRLAQKRSTGTLRPCPEESINWDTTQNLYIEGDNLEVLKLLQTAYYRKVKMIYIDPPYNTGNDFVYADDFADPMARYKEVTQQTTKSNPETMGRYHTNWLNMMYPRLRLAANLLRDDGVIFISIDDNEVDNLKKLCNEVFGEENFVAQFIWQKRTSPDARKKISDGHEYIVMYCKTADLLNDAVSLLPLSDKDRESYKNPDNDVRGPWVSSDFTAQGYRPNQMYKITTPGGAEYYPPAGTCWKNVEEVYLQQAAEGRFWYGTDGKGMPRRKTYLAEKQGRNMWTWWPNSEVGHTQEATKEIKSLFADTPNIFDFPKPTRLLKRMVSIASKNDDIILDFFSGSATTAHAVMQLNAEDGGNRRFILVQLPELCDEKSEAYKAGYKNICEIGKERIRRAGKKILEEHAQVTMAEDKQPLDVGFRVFKLDTSNLETWDATPIENEQLDLLYQRMNSMIHRVKPERTDLDMIYEIMLKLGVPLTYSVTPFSIHNKTVYGVGDDCLLLVCLAEDVQPEDVEQMTEYAPAKIIISRDSFADDTAMANAYYILRDHGIELKLV